MCLILKPNSKVIKAKKDIVCYKILEKADNIEIFCFGSTSGIPVAIVVDSKLVFPSLYQELCSCEEEKALRRIRNSASLMSFKSHAKHVTFVRKYPVEIGKTYYSKLKKETEECYASSKTKFIQVNVGIHSYANLQYCLEEIQSIETLCVAECIIPEGYFYYKGEFNHTESYASNALKYVRIINE